MKSIAFFNNKGGVGKTTLVSNIGHYLSENKGKRVLLLDLDPQCNSTQLVLSVDTCSRLYWPDDPELGNATDLNPVFAAGEVGTIIDAVRPLEEGEASVASVLPVGRDLNRFKFDILPGHPRLSMFEDQLGKWFGEAMGGEIAGLRKTLWLRDLLGQFSSDYDVVLIDLGPSLGALNRSILAVADYFITPMGADIFSVVALRNIAEWLGNWNRQFAQGVSLCDQNNPGATQKYSIPTELPITHGFAGYTVQQYSTVTIRGERRATIAYDRILGQVPEQVGRYLFGVSANALSKEDLVLGDIPHLRSLVPLAQSANSPLGALTGGDGLTGGQYAQQKSYVDLISQVGNRLLENCFGQR